MDLKNRIKKCDDNNCGYEWISRIDNPVSCPKCKKRFDYEPKKEEK